MNKDKIAGQVKATGGKIRAKVGEITGDKEAEARGRADQVTGNAQKAYGHLKDALK